MKIVWYRHAVDAIPDRQRSFDWVDDEIKIALATPAYAPDMENHQWFSQVKEIDATGSYTAGGVRLIGKRVLHDAVLKLTMMHAEDGFFDELGSIASPVAVRYAVIYRNVNGNSAQSPLLALVDFEQTATLTGQPLTVVWSQHGALTLQVVP